MTFKPAQTIRFPKVSVPGQGPPPAPEDVEIREDRITEPAISLPRPAVRDRANLTLLTGPSAGEVHPLEGEETIIGRDEEAHLRVPDSSISRQHARIVRQPSGEFAIEDMRSTNGTYVGSELVTRRVLRSGDQIQLGPNVTWRFAVTDEVEERLQRQLFESSIRDPLTHAYNRKYLNERLAAEVAHARRHGTKLALLMLDLDNFKGTNDTHGHLAGDAVLRHVAETMLVLIRMEDVFARFGGEEFVVLARGDGVRNASQFAERLRRGIAESNVEFEGVPLRVTVSIGVAELHELAQPAEPQDLIQCADTRLYRAKARGRNCVASSDS
jgi:two-component system, cell cycle response regulator